MLIRINEASEKPLYQQLHDQIVEGIATGQLSSGEKLPSVRSLANDLGINLHTVNKAYAVLRDEGYVTMRGRAGATIVEPGQNQGVRVQIEDERMDAALFQLALAFRARGGGEDDFLAHAGRQAKKAYESAHAAPLPAITTAPHSD